MKNIKKYCKEYKLKFVALTTEGFIASFKVPVKAGMEYNVNTGKVISPKIKEIGSKTVKYNFTTHPDGDITWGIKIA